MSNSVETQSYICATVCIQAADRLYAHLLERHVSEDGTVIGPDPGVRLNLRIMRFIKSYLRALPWHDNLYYLQAQAYWIRDNIVIFNRTQEEQYLERALQCADVVLSRQTEQGYWEYPQAEWSGRVATVEGCFGALCLLGGFELANDEKYLRGAKAWYDFMVDKVGFQRYDDDSLAVNYFSNVNRGLVPNNSTLALWFAAALAQASGDKRYLEFCAPMINFLARCQLNSGELPYIVESDQGNGREHYLCFQYNAFQFLDLAEYYRISRDERILFVMKRLAEFLSTGFTGNGNARHDCLKAYPTMHYFTSALTAALVTATDMKLGDYSETAKLGCGRLLKVQRKDGGFDYSLGDYGFLSDRRSYPRNQAMILRHLLIAGNRTFD